MKYVTESTKNYANTGAVVEGKNIYRSKRVDELRNLLIDKVPAMCSERAVLITESYKQTENEPVVIRKAKALAHILENKKIFILDNELIVGNLGSKTRCGSIFPEFGIKWVIEELDGNPMRPENRPGDRYVINKEDEANIREIAEYWKGRTHEERVLARMPEGLMDSWKVGVVDSYWLLIGGEGHLTVDLKRVLREGMISFKSQAQERLKNIDFTVPEQVNQVPFLESVVICCDGVIKYANRFSELAKAMAKEEKDKTRKEELLKIVDVCARVPAFPARDFHEAVQACWFINLILQIDNNGHSISLGRFDQNLIGYYEKDVKKGTLNRDDAVELLSCLFLKLFQLIKLQPWSSVKSFAGYQLWQNITISGQDKNGKDVTNELSYLVLETQAAIKLHTPSISLRYHDRISERFLQAALDVIKLGGGQPAIYSDEVYIPALVNRGIAWEDAVEYSVVGCVEAVVEGKQSTRPNGAAFINFGKILELALYNGKDPRTGMTLCAGNGDLSTFTSYDQVYEAFKKQAAYYFKQQIIGDNLIDLVTEEGIADPFVSLLVEDCIGRGKTIKQGGAIYDYCGPLYVGIANVGNSLAAVKKLVFDDKVITGAQLKYALETNYQDQTTSPTGAEIRKMLIEAPKYGNDDDYVDSIMVDYFRFVCEETAKYKTTRYGRGPIGCTWQPSTSSVSANVPFGEIVGATPDGRMSGEALADTVSPMHGTDVKGPTSSLKSVGKLPTVLVSGGQLLNMKISPSSIAKEGGRAKFISLLRTYLGDFKGMHIQFNIVDADVLKAAQKDPDKYKDLMVRVAGYSALFTPLDKALQDDIIERTEHTM